MVTFSHITRWIINIHQHCSVQGKRSSIQLTFHVYFWPTAFNPFFKPSFSSFSLKEKSSIKNFPIAHCHLRKYRKYYFTCNVHVKRRLAFALEQRGSSVFQNSNDKQQTEEEEKEEEIQTDADVIPKKYTHACILYSAMQTQFIMKSKRFAFLSGSFKQVKTFCFKHIIILAL